MEFGQISSYHSHKYLFINCVQKEQLLQLALKQMNLLWDLQYLLLIGSCLLLKPCVWGYFGIHIFLGFFYVICHIKAASQNMRIAEDAGVKGRSWN